jgi:8-oxo-dGTP pyrophosphatase MutT (NUDIX family)
VSKPYRERAELFAQNPQGRIYGGFYPGQGFGTFGGGVDPGEDPQEAAAREFQEESGYPVSNVRPAPVDPYVEDWKAFSKKPEYANDPKFQERFKKFKGSRTHYFLGDIAGKRESKGSNDAAYPFESVRFRAAPTVISKHEKDLQSVTDPIDIARLQQRLAVLRNLQGTNKEVEQAARRAEQVGSSIRKFFTRVR